MSPEFSGEDEVVRENQADRAPRVLRDRAAVYVAEVVVRGFRGLGECHLHLEPGLTVIVGRNNAGKSRLLRAIAVALGALPADRDDWTVDSADAPTIDLVLAPLHGELVDEEFDEQVGRRLRLDVSLLSEDPVRERFAWRTTIRRSAEGLGVLAENSVLQFDAKDRRWHLPAQPRELTREQRRLVAAYLVDSRRDLADDLVRRGSPIRQILDDLEISELERETLEAALSDLGVEVVAKSRSLAAVQSEMDVLSGCVGSVGSAHISPLPARLEELGRLVVIGFDTGSGDLPIRLHGAGARSLAALQTQGVLYARRLGKDGPTLQPRPVSLIEEPEAHLHPQAQFDLVGLLAGMTGQVIVSTHSAHLVSAVEPSAIRMLFPEESQVRVVDLRPAVDDESAAHRALRPSLHLEEMERLRRLIERPFGELLFSSAVIIGDGSTERALLPPLLSHRLGPRAHGVTCVDPGSMGGQLAVAVVKFCELVRIPWFLFADSDEDGTMAANRIIDEHGGGDMSHVVWVDDEGGAATEKMFLEFDEGLARRACTTLGMVDDASPLLFMKRKKGAIGRVLAEKLMEEHPWPSGSTDVSPWPEPIVELISKLEAALWEKEGVDD